MGQHGTLFGVILGAVIVGATLTIKDALDDPETAANVRRKVAEGCQTVKTKICEGGAALREKMEEGGTCYRRCRHPLYFRRPNPPPKRQESHPRRKTGSPGSEGFRNA